MGDYERPTTSTDLDNSIARGLGLSDRRHSKIPAARGTWCRQIFCYWDSCTSPHGSLRWSGGDCVRLLRDRRIVYEIGSNPSIDRYICGDSLNQDSHLAWSWLLAFHSPATQTLRP